MKIWRDPESPPRPKPRRAVPKRERLERTAEEMRQKNSKIARLKEAALKQPRGPNGRRFAKKDSNVDR